jgi:hypothetical protein
VYFCPDDEDKNMHSAKEMGKDLFRRPFIVDIISREEYCVKFGANSLMH